MINKTHYNNIILLEMNNGISSISYCCYPAKAIGTVDQIANAGFDYCFYVEDIMAKHLLKKMISRYMTLNQEHQSAFVNITPVGGYLETAKLALETRQRILLNTKVYAVLDDDAFSARNPEFNDISEKNQKAIWTLGCTPELLLINKFEKQNGDILASIRNDFHCDYNEIALDAKYLACDSPNERKKCKKKLDVLISILIARSGESEALVIDKFVEIIINTMSNGDICRILSPMFRIN